MSHSCDDQGGTNPRPHDRLFGTARPCPPARGGRCDLATRIKRRCGQRRQNLQPRGGGSVRRDRFSRKFAPSHGLPREPKQVAWATPTPPSLIRGTSLLGRTSDIRAGRAQSSTTPPPVDGRSLFGPAPRRANPGGSLGGGPVPAWVRIGCRFWPGDEPQSPMEVVRRSLGGSTAARAGSPARPEQRKLPPRRTWRR